MRKLAAIFMLGVFTFNIIGYQLLYNYFSSQSDIALENALDENAYDESELISIKQPATLPYYTNNKNFQRIDGEVEMNGVKYKYVQCRIYNDSLEMLCIPNKAKMKIEQSRNQYASIINDFQQDNSKKKSDNNSKSFQKNFNEYEELHCAGIAVKSVLLSTHYVLVNSVPEESLFFKTVEQPPEMMFA